QTPSGIDCPLQGWSKAINNNNVIAGGPQWNNFAHAFFILPTSPYATVDTVTELVPPSPGPGDRAYAINDKLILAGNAQVTSICTDPVAGAKRQGPPLDIGGGNCGSANGIDESQVVIGSVRTQGYQAFIWTTTTGIQALPGLGGTNETSEAAAINNKRE